jgi:hypothetical protein
MAIITWNNKKSSYIGYNLQCIIKNTILGWRKTPRGMLMQEACLSASVAQEEREAQVLARYHLGLADYLTRTRMKAVGVGSSRQVGRVIAVVNTLPRS